MGHVSLKAALMVFLATVSILPSTIHAASSSQRIDLLGSEKGASEHTAAFNQEMLKRLPVQDRRDFENAARGLMERGQEVIKNSDGKVVWDVSRLKFLHDLGKKAPPTVNPSLWRQMQLVSMGGLFKVHDRIYQVRNYDLSNITFIEGKTGLIIVDPLLSAAPAKAALELYFKHRPRKPVVAVIYTHSHVDHFGGVKGVVDERAVKAGKVKIIAPEGFMDSVIAENVMAGNAMLRRATYMFGKLCPMDEKGNVGAGLGVTTSRDKLTLIPPTQVIGEDWQNLVIDGLHFEFQLARDTEAPAEMHFFIREYKALCPAENASCTMHNLYSLRGTKVRNARQWARQLDRMLVKWGSQAQILFRPHHWPVWGSQAVGRHLSLQRDTYKYIHDQTLRLANQGYTIEEVGDLVKLPPQLDQQWSSRGNYGSVSHNARAVYNFYLGFFDGNPSHLNRLPPRAAAKKYVEYMGGPEKVMSKAARDMEAGEYRWAAEVLDRVVFADPKNIKARNLLADALEQLGYAAESGPWRNFYLMGARELRQGVKPLAPRKADPKEIAANMPMEMMLDYLAIRLNPEKAGDRKIKINFVCEDVNEQHSLFLENATINNRPGLLKDADATIITTRKVLNEVFAGETTMAGAIKSGKVKIKGAPGKLRQLMGMLDSSDPWFNIVTP